MAGFCTSCGAPLTGPFCGKCGHPADAPTHGATPPASAAVPAALPQPAATVPAKQGGGLGKVLLILALIFGIFVVLGIGGVFYGLYWARKRVSTCSAALQGQHPDQVVVAHGNSCALLPKAELQTVLGINIEKSEEIQEGDNPGCAYFTNADGFAQLRKMTLAEAQRESAQASATQKPGEKIDNPLELLKDTKDMQGIVKALGMQEPAKDGQVFSFTVDRNAGADSWAGARAAIAVAPGFAEISGVGDHAMVGTFGHIFYAMKGNTAVALTTIYVPDAQTRGADIARRILARL